MTTESMPWYDKIIDEEDICPVCHVEIIVVGVTDDGTLIGSCGCEFTRQEWEEECEEEVDDRISQDEHDQSRQQNSE